MSFQIDFEDNSTTAMGGKSKGTIYLRGIIGHKGFNSFKFILEKSVDFCDLDSQILINAIEHVNNIQPSPKETAKGSKNS